MKDIVTGIVFDLEKFALVDGPGIRTAVFLKGCPLKCVWCHNPESQEMSPQTLYAKNLCKRCGACVHACPAQALSLDADGVTLNKALCMRELRCADVCPSGAMKQSGKFMTVQQVLSEVEKNKNFYRNSGGGVTVSGGEPLMQWRFTKELFRLCRESNIHTALDTCGFADASQLQQVLDYTDLVMYDLKVMDSVLHERFTGVPNDRILQNLKLVSRSEVSYCIRIPLIPHYTATEENLTAIGEYLKELRQPLHIELLPYHNMAKAKYEWLKGQYALDSLPQLTDIEIEHFETLLCKMGFSVQIGG